MIEALTRLFRRTTPSEPSVPVSEWDAERKRAVGKKARFRCASCDGPEFRQKLFLSTALDADEGIVPLCASCLSAAGRGEDATEERRLPRSLRGDHGFLIAPAQRETQRFRSHGERETMVVEPGDPTDPDDEDDAWMGKFPRKLVEQKYQYPREQLYLGHGTRAGLVRKAGAPFGSQFRHIYINGIPGMGKSVLAGNMGLQHIWSGHGLCVIDPHDDLVDYVLRTIPAHRRDDVVLVEPSPGDAERIVGLNLLEVEPEPDDPEHDEAVDEAIDIIVSVLRGGEGWGQRMGPICENLCRAMILAEKDYTFVDFRRILLDASRRQTLATETTEEGHDFVADYTRKIAEEMDQDELGSLVRRVNRWVESRLTREIVAHKESSISFRELIDDDAIILVRNDVGNGDIEQMIATGLLRRIWQVVRNRPEPERSPFFFIMDEAHEVLSPEMNMGTMLTGARKYQFGLVLMSQYLNKIDVPEVKEAIDQVCDTVITFRAKGGAADYLAEHYEISKKTIKKLPNYHALATLERDGEPKGPFEIRTFAPYPPLRTREEAREWIVKPSLQRYGVERLTDQKIRYRSGGDSTVGVDETIGEDEEDDDPFELTTERLAAICQAVLDESIDQERDDNAVRWDGRLTTRLTDYHDAGERIVHASHKGALFDSLPLGDKDADGDEVPLRCWEDDNGEMWLQVTSLGQSKVFETGTAASSGGPKHRKLLRDCYRPFSTLGGIVNLPSQTGESMPDGSLSIDWQGLAEEVTDDESTVDWQALSDDDQAALKERLREDLSETRPLLSWLTAGRETAIEAECTTGDSKGGQTARNVAEAVNAAQRCLLLCREHTAEQVWNTLTKPPYLSEYSDLKHGKERLYNLGDHTILDEKLLRPAGPKQTVWIHDRETDEYVLTDSDGNEHNRFATATGVFEDAGSYPWSMDDPDGNAEIPDGWTTVKRPFVPDYDFEEGIPDRNAWEIIIVESGASAPDDLAVYRDGDTIPLTDIRLWEQQRQTAANQAESQTESPTDGQISDETAGMLDDILDSNGAHTDD
jgi:hypothetical protein